LDGPWENEPWGGTKIGEIVVPANSKQEVTQFTIDVAKHVDRFEKEACHPLPGSGRGQNQLTSST